MVCDFGITLENGTCKIAPIPTYVNKTSIKSYWIQVWSVRIHTKCYSMTVQDNYMYCDNCS